jgi:hypothetical protein
MLDSIDAIGFDHSSGVDGDRIEIEKGEDNSHGRENVAPRGSQRGLSGYYR